MTELSRRSFLGAAAALPVAAALPAWLFAQSEPMAVAAAGLRVGETFTIAGVYRWDVAFGEKVLQPFVVRHVV